MALEGLPEIENVTFDSGTETFAVELAVAQRISWGEVVETIERYEADHQKLWNIRFLGP